MSKLNIDPNKFPYAAKFFSSHPEIKSLDDALDFIDREINFYEKRLKDN